MEEGTFQMKKFIHGKDDTPWKTPFLLHGGVSCQPKTFPFLRKDKYWIIQICFQRILSQHIDSAAGNTMSVPKESRSPSLWDSLEFASNCGTNLCCWTVTGTEMAPMAWQSTTAPALQKRGKGQHEGGNKEIWRKISIVEPTVRGHTRVPAHLTDTWIRSGDTGRGALGPGWILTFPAQHLHLQSKAVRAGKVPTAQFVLHYFSVLKSLLGEENQWNLSKKPHRALQPSELRGLRSEKCPF